MRLTPRRGAQPSWPSAQKRAGGDTRPRGTELGWWWWVARGGAAMGLGWSRGCERCQLVVSCPWMAEQRRRGHWIALPGLAALQAATWPQFQPESASGTRPRGTESDCSTTAARRGMRARRRCEVGTRSVRCGAHDISDPQGPALVAARAAAPVPMAATVCSRPSQPCGRHPAHAIASDTTFSPAAAAPAAPDPHAPNIDAAVDIHAAPSPNAAGSASCPASTLAAAARHIAATAAISARHILPARPRAGARTPWRLALLATVSSKQLGACCPPLPSPR